MSLQDLALPVDVPWQLIATSRKDMLASHNDVFPNAMWRSSLAVFAYDPDLSDLPEVFPDRALTFLKVVCSITSYAPGQQDLPPPPVLIDELYQQYEDDLKAWKQKVKELEKLEHMTFPCSGALVQVAITPRAMDTDKEDISQLAYFASLEPQKRELIEAVTESGEAVTQSKSALDVRKGVTATDSMEDRNLFTGANLNVGAGGAQVGVGVQGQWGTIKKSGTDTVNMTNTDTSRETREGSSHTTSLSQLYHLLNSYHLGTNRAIFFLQPRPHTVQQKDRFTFIDGPQEIEGIQEFFLVVSRPKEVKLEDYSVDALLLTAHLEPDTTSAALLEPKTIETEWIDLWATAKSLGKHTLDPVAFIGAILAPGIPGIGDPATVSQLTVNFLNQQEQALRQAFETQLQGQPSGGALISTPAILDQTITPPVPNGKGITLSWIDTTIFGIPIKLPVPKPPDPVPGWKVDRTRGLGGYDLWEDPDNKTATPIGGKPVGGDNEADISKTPPQAFVDIISQGDPDDLLHYQPDYAVRVRAYAWPGNEDAMYHGRIKVYFIRDDTATDNRSLRMFITARGVSSNPLSLFAMFYDDPSVDPSLGLDIAKDALIHPPNIAPWQSPPVVNPWTWNMQSTSLTSSMDSSKQTGTTSPPPLPPINSAKPSGFDPIALGSARAKMANAISNEVRMQLKTALTSPPPQLFNFRAMDLFFHRMARVVIAEEIGRLAASGDAEAHLLSQIAAHPLLAHVVNPGQQTLPALIGNADMEAATIKKKSLPASASFPALTLAGPALSHQDRQALRQAAVLSGLDLIDLPANELALRMGIDEARARQIRLQAIGLDTEEVALGLSPRHGSIGSTPRQGVRQVGRRLR